MRCNYFYMVENQFNNISSSEYTGVNSSQELLCIRNSAKASGSIVTMSQAVVQDYIITIIKHCPPRICKELIGIGPKRQIINGISTTKNYLRKINTLKTSQYHECVIRSFSCFNHFNGTVPEFCMAICYIAYLHVDSRFIEKQCSLHVSLTCN